jgi:hypothetical protein
LTLVQEIRVVVNFTEEAEYELKDAIVKDALFEILNLEDEEGEHPEDKAHHREIRYAAEVLLSKWFMARWEWDLLRPD